MQQTPVDASAAKRFEKDVWNEHLVIDAKLRRCICVTVGESMYILPSPCDVVHLDATHARH
jgi:hypothetical protein